MQFALTEEQLLLQDTVRSVLAERAGSAVVRSAMTSELGYDPALWKELTAELGLGGVALPTSLGGSGMGMVGLAIVMMELGRSLLPSPFASSVGMALAALMEQGTEEQQQRLLPQLAEGRLVAALAYRGTGRELIPAMRLRGDSSGALGLTGTCGFVPFGHAADLLLVVAVREDGSSALVLVPRDAEGLTIERQTTMDLTRPLAAIRFENVAINADQLVGTGDAAPAVARVLDRARIGIAAEQAGGTDGVLDLTVDYSKTREQFGRPIGSFQALKHRMADMMVLAETAKTAAYYAACIADEGSDELPEAAAIAASYCSDAFTRCAGDAIQLHGGIGFTWEHDAHLYFKRAKSSALLLGDPAFHRERVAQLIGLEGERA